MCVLRSDQGIVKTIKPDEKRAFRHYGPGPCQAAFQELRHWFFELQYSLVPKCHTQHFRRHWARPEKRVLEILPASFSTYIEVSKIRGNPGCLRMLPKNRPSHVYGVFYPAIVPVKKGNPFTFSGLYARISRCARSRSSAV